MLRSEATLWLVASASGIGPYVPGIITAAVTVIGAQITAIVFIIRWAFGRIEEARVDKNRTEEEHGRQVERLTAMLESTYREMYGREKSLNDIALPRLSERLTDAIAILKDTLRDTRGR